MTSHLLAVTVGPVQEFIAAARRTRDLWFGSTLLSEISKATAKAVRVHGGNLIFPAPSSAADLEPDSELNIANIILAELLGADPNFVAQSARQAARARWRQFADTVFQRYKDNIQAKIWDDQVNDIIEFYAAWVPSTTETYRQDRARLMRLLAGRKNCRDFLPAPRWPGVPKSSLDGLRESVLLKKGNKSQSGLRLSDGEQLDVVGLVKRAALGTRPYPSVARVAADPWLRGCIDKLKPLMAAFEKIPSLRRDYPVYKDFPFEGTVVYSSRHADLQKEADLSVDDLRPLKNALGPLLEKFGEPSPYLAVLAADGDKMGEALAHLDSAKQHRDFSQRLAGFASAARQIVEAAHRGVLVYAGGDDVLAFVPVNHCLKCARALREQFQTLTDRTLSIGLAIAHYMEPLEDLLDFGRAAEKHAKHPGPEGSGQESRDGLAVHLLKRGGGPVTMRANWTTQPDKGLLTLAQWINDRAISGRVAYDLRNIAGVYDDWPDGTVVDSIQRDTLAVMKGKQPPGKSKMPEIGQFIRDRVQDAASLRQFSDELLLARQIAVAMRQASGQLEVTEASA
jgi:CRISPR-associated protein Cmr2